MFIVNYILFMMGYHFIQKDIIFSPSSRIVKVTKNKLFIKQLIY